ncbi:type II toxin-antitoxin system RelB/DinJ family antitoxin [Candidatus Gottesmanbacteria bacterium]|nr:type II toxin-antitoxin system RelB/DinJ family antitoxin [Candidatus Gottesmanbacteria bacterium]
MNTAIVNAKIDPQIKKKAQKIASEIGVSLSDVVNAKLREFIEEKTITFRKREELSDYAIQSLKESMDDIKAGRVSPAFTNTKDAIEWLNNPKRKYANQLQPKVR